MAILKSAASTGGRIRILQIFSRYREYGGEEGSVYRIGDAMHRDFDIGFFSYSTEQLLSNGLLSKTLLPLRAFHNSHVIRELRSYQKAGNFDFWQIHNVFPAMSPAVYGLAFELGVPIVHYLHNYRLGCVNGFFLNHGSPCQRCEGGDFMPAFLTACWHDSKIQSGLMGAVTKRARGMGLFDKVAHWVALSHSQAQEHVNMGIPSDRISVIPHFFESSEDPPLHPEKGDAIFVGRLSPEKGVDRLLRAWSSIQECGRHLWIVGDGPERARLEVLSASLSLRNVTFTGFLQRSDMGDLWKRSACSIVPSIWKEPFGMVVLEAWSRCRPVVAFRIGALPEVIDDGVNGLLVDAESDQQLGAAILSLLKDPLMAARLGMEGYKKLQLKHSRSIWQDNILQVYKQLDVPKIS